MITKTYAQALREFQMNLLVDALVQTEGNVLEAALVLGIHRNTFHVMLESASLLSTTRVRELLREAGLIAPRKLPKAQKPQPGTARANAA
jgi:transcriptional regulator of acetoin/glycerol metabolism